MSWQEELRKLDEELAAGQISADDYRVRRDQVLSSAVSSSGDPKPAQQPSLEATQFVQPVQPPPPMQQPPPGPPVTGNESDKTQIVSGQLGGESDRTQAVGGWHAARPGEADSDRTQVVPGVPPQSTGGVAPRPAPGQFPPPPGYQQPQTGWGHGEDVGPPWGGQDFPPLASTGSPDWVRQGPEVFETESKSKTGKVLLIVLIVVLVASLGVGGYFLFGNKKNNEPSGQTTTNQPPPTTSSTPRQPKDDLFVAELPGKSKIQDRINTFADFEADEFGKLLTAEELAVYKQATPGKARLVVSDIDGGAHAYILTIETGSAAKAAAVRDGLVDLQTKYNMQPYKGTVPPGVKATEFPKSGDIPATFRAHYTHKTTVVRIQIYGDDPSKISVTFDDIIRAQLEALPADD